MATYSYKRDVPNQPNNPSVDAPNMKINTNSTADILSENHFGFNVANGGKHRYIQLPTVTAPAGSTGTTELLLYNGILSGVQNLFYVPNNKVIATNYVQMTRQERPVASSNGYSWLPGGILIQWGTSAVSASGTRTTVTYPLAFPSGNPPFSITIGCITNEGTSPSANNQFIDSTVGFAPSATNFRVVNSSSSGARSIYWMAIGV